MSEVINPYAPPTVPVADVYEQSVGYQPVKLFSSQGRIGRLRFFAYLVTASLVGGVVQMLLPLLGALIGTTTAMMGFSLIGGVSPFIYIVFAVLLYIQRSHDMDWTGWSCLLALIPFVGFVWIFKRGSYGANRFGNAPPPNTLGIKIFGIGAAILGCVAVLGIAAAIALPAYQNYVAKGKAAEVVRP